MLELVADSLWFAFLVRSAFDAWSVFLRSGLVPVSPRNPVAEVEVVGGGADRPLAGAFCPDSSSAITVATATTSSAPTNLRTELPRIHR